jgi:ABC-2 type transport system permease protein
LEILAMFSKLGARFPILTKVALRFEQMTAIVEADLRKLRHDPTELFARMIQPVIWLLIFGQAMGKARAIPTGESSYLDYLAPGVLAQSILFISIFYGISLIWERDMGVLHKILVTPTPRFILVLGRAFAAGIRALSQAIIIYILCYFIGIHVSLDGFALVGVFIMVLLAAGIFSTFSLIVASLVKKRERFMGIGQVMTMPLFFASNALYPIDIMPTWIRILSKINPLTYQVDAIRSLMIVGETSHFGLGFDFTIEAIVFAILIAIASRLYPKILY